MVTSIAQSFSQERLIKAAMASMASPRSLIEYVTFDRSWPRDMFGGTVTIKVSLPPRDFYDILEEYRRGY